jgi:endonuclease III
VEEEKLIRKLLEALGGRFSKALGIDLEGGDSEEVFKWFLAAILYGARISETIATRTYREFEARGVLSPEAILEARWEGLVRVLDDGGYVRYDFKTATKLLEVMTALKKQFNGDLNQLHAQAESPEDLEEKLMALGKGIGPVTVDIFLRELRDVWQKADPLPQNLAVLAAQRLGFTKLAGSSDEGRREIMGQWRAVWEQHALPGWGFADFEAALVRLGKGYCRRRRWAACPLGEQCGYRPEGS